MTILLKKNFVEPDTRKNTRTVAIIWLYEARLSTIRYCGYILFLVARIKVFSENLTLQLKLLWRLRGIARWTSAIARWTSQPRHPSGVTLC